MDIMLVSQCDHRALKETRRILDQFACRAGDRSWQTPITEAGLETLHRMLRASARKNTAVACWRFSGWGLPELLWIVGDKSRFNASGHAPTQFTARDVLRSDDECHWDSAELVRLLARMAGLLHDLGKGSRAFQDKLRGKGGDAKNLWRHEWQSARMFAHFVKTAGTADADWLKRLAAEEAPSLEDWRPEWGAEDDWKKERRCPLLRGLPPLARMVAWLILSHHRLPIAPKSKDMKFGDINQDFRISDLSKPLDLVKAEWNNPLDPELLCNSNLVSDYTDFASLKDVFANIGFAKKLHNTATRLLKWSQGPCGAWSDWENDPYILSLARLSLMLADHHVSAQSVEPKDKVKPDEAAANTGKDHCLKQSLGRHLVEVGLSAGSIASFLQTFPRFLGGISPQKLRNFRKLASEKRFSWQDKARATAVVIDEDVGVFMVNMASTGCGKTLGNAKILEALTPKGQSPRMTYALGLRVLTRQTGDAYREHLNLNEEELGVFVGGAVGQEIANFLAERSEETGSESVQSLLPPEIGDMDFSGDASRDEEWSRHPVLKAVFGVGKEDKRLNRKERAFLDAPVMVCTVDHMVPATEAWKGGGQISPLLRLMSSDLILDELDDYALEDMPALTRLVWFAGMMGRRVLLSSATLPGSLVRGMFLAYRAGRRIYLKNHGGLNGSLGNKDIEEPQISCLWVDEFAAKGTVCLNEASFKECHEEFTRKRGIKLRREALQAPLRRGAIIGQEELGAKGKWDKEEIPQLLAGIFRDNALKLHEWHGREPTGDVDKGKKISFGIIRMANITSLYRTAQELFRLGSGRADILIHLCVYHSRFPLIARSKIEEGLDKAFNRRKLNAVWNEPIVRASLNSADGEIKNHVFIVLASPVCEVGRDWDADWAIAEPSSLRSIIQLAGRVRRHRRMPCEEGRPNILLLDKNVRALKGEEIAYKRPGYESGDFKLTAHNLSSILRESEYDVITSIPRLLPPKQRDPKEKSRSKEKLGDLELMRTRATALPPQDVLNKWSTASVEPMTRTDASLCWQEEFNQSALTGLLPQNQPFRAQTMKEDDLAFVLDKDRNRGLAVIQKAHKTRGSKDLYVDCERDVERIDLSCAPGITPWNTAELKPLLEKWLERNGINDEEARIAEARRVTAFSAPHLKDGRKWDWNEVLGLSEN